jgi:sulfonate transport system permease protein
LRAAALGKLPLALAGLIVPVLLLAIWQLVTATGLFSASQLPPPADVVTALGGLVRYGELWTHLRASVSRVLLGYLAGAGAALALGSLVGLSVTARRLLAPTVAALRTVPSLAWVPLLLLWFGIDETPKLRWSPSARSFPSMRRRHRHSHTSSHSFWKWDGPMVDTAPPC